MDDVVKNELDDASDEDKNSASEFKVNCDESLQERASINKKIHDDTTSAELKVSNGKSLLDECSEATTASGEDKSSLELKVSSDKSRQQINVIQNPEYQQRNMSKHVEYVVGPPAFINDNKSYAEYKKDLLRWSRICGIDKKLQADHVVLSFDQHPSRIKEKVDTQIGDKLIDNEQGLKELITFLDGIYTKDTMADAWDKFCEFSEFSKKSEHTMAGFNHDENADKTITELQVNHRNSLEVKISQNKLNTSIIITSNFGVYRPIFQPQ